ncbi:MAG: hypothetical protein O6920_04685 [Chloroflexi bacterium]|nr:hypothetical protein [Chloroflexota bacterium]
MDPEFITNEHWADISTVLRFLWLYWLFIIGFATNMLLAHALIPSLIASGQLPSSMGRVRPLLYLSALGILTIAILFLVLSVVNADVIGRISERWWI